MQFAKKGQRWLLQMVIELFHTINMKWQNGPGKLDRARKSCIFKNYSEFCTITVQWCANVVYFIHLNLDANSLAKSIYIKWEKGPLKYLPSFERHLENCLFLTIQSNFDTNFLILIRKVEWTSYFDYIQCTKN